MANPTPVLSRRLSGMDAAFLYLERKEIPLNIACVALFDGPLPFADFVANIDSKLDLIPRYRQLAVPPVYNLGYPNWEYDPNFDIRRHIFHARLEPPGGEAELERFASRLLSLPLDRGKPLWELHLVDGLQDGRGALIARIHHALADGVAGAAILKIMFDPTLEGSYAIRKPRRAAVPPRAEHSLAEQIGNAIQSALENVVAAEAGLLSLAEGLLGDRGNGALQELATLLPELLKPPERFVFNKPCSGDRKFCWTEVEFSEVQAIRSALGGKVNDCILSVVVRALSRYIRAHGEKIKGRFLRVVCPVNVRGEEHGESLGNRITFLPVILPLDVEDPVEMLRAVSARMELMKSVRAAELITIAASCLGTLPAPAQEIFWRGLPMIPLPLPLLNIICTNVPGSPTALYSVGRRLEALYPQVPTGYELGLAVAVQSYNGKLFFGITADAHVAPDSARLRDYILTAFQELCKSAGVKRPRDRKESGKRGRPNASDKASHAAANGTAYGDSIEPRQKKPIETAIAVPAPQSVSTETVAVDDKLHSAPADPDRRKPTDTATAVPIPQSTSTEAAAVNSKHQRAPGEPRNQSTTKTAQPAAQAAAIPQSASTETAAANGKHYSAPIEPRLKKTTKTAQPAVSAAATTNPRSASTETAAANGKHHSAPIEPRLKKTTEIAQPAISPAATTIPQSASTETAAANGKHYSAPAAAHWKEPIETAQPAQSAAATTVPQTPPSVPVATNATAHTLQETTANPEPAKIEEYA